MVSEPCDPPPVEYVRVVLYEPLQSGAGAGDVQCDVELRHAEARAEIFSRRADLFQTLFQSGGIGLQSENDLEQ